MSKTRDLWCRSGRWYFRKRFPKDVRKALGKEHFIQALKTSDREAALRKRPLIEMEFNALVDRTRRSNAPEEREVSEAELIGMVHRWFREASEAELPSFDPDELDHELELRGMFEGDYREYLANGNLRPVRNQIKSLLEEAKVDLPETSETYQSLGRFILRGIIENLRLESARLTGDYTYLPADPMFREALASSQSTKDNHMTFGQLIDAYEAEKSPTWAPKTRLDYAGRLKLLREVIGRTRKVATIDRAVCRKVREVVVAIPPNHTKLKDMAGMTAPKAAEYAKSKGLAGLKPKTANSYLILLSALFRWAVQEDYMTRNPTNHYFDVTRIGSAPGITPQFLQTYKWVAEGEPFAPASRTLP